MRDFERFKSQLRQLPREDVEKLLNDQMQKKCGELWGVYADGRIFPPQRQSVERKFAVQAMALHSLTDTGETPPIISGFPVWLGVARRAIADFAMADSNNREFMLESLFFTANSRTLRGLNVLASASISPGSDYDPQSFAAGIASGMLTSVDPVT